MADISPVEPTGSRLLLSCTVCVADIRERQTDVEQEKKVEIWNMALSKIRKGDVENRVFQVEWREKYAFILPAASSTRLVGLICAESVAVVKSGNLKHHFETKYGHFKVPAAVRSKNTENNWKPSLFPCRTYECSLRIQWILGQHKKPFTDGTIVKKCMDAASETLWDGKERHEVA